MDVLQSVADSSQTPPASSIDIPNTFASHLDPTPNATPNRPSKSSKDRERRTKDRHGLALKSIRDFLRGRSSYDVLPVSFRLIVLDTKLVVKPALDVMWQAGVVSAPLWQSTPPQMLGDRTSEVDDTNTCSQTGPSSPQGEQMPLAAKSADETSAYRPEHPEQKSETNTSSDVQEPPTVSNTLMSDDTSSQQRSASLCDRKAAPKTSPRYPPSGFAGMLTVNDIIHLIQYYYHHSSYDSAAEDVETFRLERLRDIEQALNVLPPPLLSVHPLKPLYEACQLLIKTHARRLPLLDYDEQTGMETVVSVLTQYRVLKFIAMNCRETASLWRSIRSLSIGTYIQSFKTGPHSSRTSSHRGSDASDPGIVKTSEYGSLLPMSGIEPQGEHDHSGQKVDGETETPEASIGPSDASTFAPSSRVSSSHPTSSPSVSGAGVDPSNPYYPLSTATLDTTVFDVVHMFSERGISAVPILDDEGNVVDMYETVDVITLVRTGAYQALDLTIRQALERRPPDFGGIWTCSPEDSLANIFALLRKRRVHRLLILEPEPNPVNPPNPLAKEQEVEKKAPPETLDDLEDFPEEPEEEKEQLNREKRQREEFVNNPKLNLEDRLGKGDPVRKKRGKLVGMLCLSDILRYVIGAPVSDLGSSGAGSEQHYDEGRRSLASRSRGTSVASTSVTSGQDKTRSTSIASIGIAPTNENKEGQEQEQRQNPESVDISHLIPSLSLSVAADKDQTEKVTSDEAVPANSSLDSDHSLPT